MELDDEHYGERPPWHDLQLELRGPAVDDIACSFAERWNDPTPLDSRNPVRAVLHRVRRAARSTRPARRRRRPAPRRRAAARCRCCARTRRGAAPYPFAPDGERSIARAYLKAFRRARRLVYLEDQYLWSPRRHRVLREALAANPTCRSSS